MTGLIDECGAWLDANWDPELTVRQWWERLGTSGWAAPHWPKDAYGLGLSTADTAQVRQVFRERKVTGPPGGFGLLLAGPTIFTHGTPEQIERYLPDIRAAGRPGASCSPSRWPGPTWPACRPGRNGTATCGGSTARRCGRRPATSPIWGC